MLSYTFEAEFGNFKIPAQQAHIHASQAEENEWHVTLFGISNELRNYFSFPSFPKGKAWIRSFVKIPPKCPNCHYQLDNILGQYELQELDCYEYTGATVKVVQSYNEDILELRIHYEMMEYKTCYQNEKNSMKS